MANSIPPLMVVNFKGSGAVTVHKLLNGITLDPVQDGGDVGNGAPPGLEVPSATLANVHANRLIEAFGKRFLLHGFRVYERDAGGDGAWGEVTGLGLSATAVAHSGLHLLHPNGVPTLAFLCETDNTTMHAIHSTDGVTWTDTDTGLSVLTISEPGHSIVYRNSIFWAAVSNDGVEIRSYDFVLQDASEYNLDNAGQDTYEMSFLVHKNTLFIGGIEILSTDNAAFWRLDGAGFSKIDMVGGMVVNPGSSFGLWSDGDDIIVCFQNANGSANRVAYRATGVLPGDSFSFANVTSPVLNNVSTTADASYIPFVAVDPDPNTHLQRVYFWQRNGDFNNGTFNLFRFEYRQLPTGAHTGAFQLGEVVTDGSATGVVTDIAVDASLSLTDVTGTWGAGPVTGNDSGATATSSGGLAEVAATSLGTGILGSNFGLPHVTDGGLDRIPTRTSARPAWDGLPLEVAGGTKWFFRVFGSTAALDLSMFHNLDEEAPSVQSTLVNGSLVKEQNYLIDLEAYYKFNNDGLDASGNGLDLTFTGTEAYATGKFGNGYDLPGNEANYAARAVNDTVLDFPGAKATFSISAWVNPTTLTAAAGFQSVVEKVNAALGWGVIVLNDGSVQFAAGGAGLATTATGVVTTGSFQHILVVNDGTTTKIYVDGTEEASAASITNNITTEPLRIGDRATSNSPWDGVIDEVAIWSRALTAAEITELYNSGSGLELENPIPTATTPTITNGTTIDNVTPDDGSALYSFIHDATTDGIDEGDRYTTILDVV
jgi:hypothetical protein